MTAKNAAIDPALALLVIDIQQGAFDGERCPPIDDGDALVAGARALVDAARDGGVPIVFIQHSEDEPGAFEDGTRHWQLHPDLAPAGDDHVMK
jgi:nicotinamidase-related amidase